MPEIRLRCAFADLRKKYDIYEKRTECLREILYCLADSTSVDEFVLREAQMRLMFPLPYFAAYDEQLSRHVIDSAKKWIPRYRELYGGQPPDAMLELAQLPKDASLTEMATRLDGTSVDVGVTVFGLMQKFAEEAAITADHQLRSLFASYDGSALTYVRALNSHTWRQVTHQDVPGRNFGVDLHHLIYLVRGSALVTCDHAMAKMAESSGAQVARAAGA